jgi:predicted ferric reductase
MADSRRRAAFAAPVLAVPAVLALTEDHLAAGPAALVLSTLAAALAVSGLALQPFLAAFGGVRLRWHRLLGAVTFLLVLAHVGGLYVVSAEDTLFALSPDGPTRARMALLATIALAVVVFLGVGRARLPLSATTWRVLHAFFAVLAVVLGIGHAVLTDGALDGAGTPVLLGFGSVTLGGIAFAAIRRARRPSLRPGGPAAGPLDSA